MPIIGIRALQRETREIFDELERDGEPVVITHHGRPVAALIPIDREQAEALVLAAAPRFRESRRAKDETGGEARTRPIEEVVSELGENMANELHSEPEAESSMPGGPAEEQPERESGSETVVSPFTSALLTAVLGDSAVTAPGLSAYAARLGPEISREADVLTATIQQSAGEDIPLAETPEGAEIIRRQLENAQMLGHVLREFLVQSVVVEKVLGAQASPDD